MWILLVLLGSLLFFYCKANQEVDRLKYLPQLFVLYIQLMQEIFKSKVIVLAAKLWLLGIYRSNNLVQSIKDAIYRLSISHWHLNKKLWHILLRQESHHLHVLNCSHLENFAVCLGRFEAQVLSLFRYIYPKRVKFIWTKHQVKLKYWVDWSQPDW